VVSPGIELDLSDAAAQDGAVRTYGQYCPVARASEIVAERWTFLIIRNLMFGADTFSALKAGVPQMSRSVLVTRLRELERAEVLRRAPKPSGGHRYELTEAGRDLAPVIDALASWGERWVEIGPEHTDPGFALWAWCEVQLDREALPDHRVVVSFTFPDRPAGSRQYWLLVEGRDAQVCYTDPGGDPALQVTAESRAFIDWHRGRLDWRRALRAGRITVSGHQEYARALPTWNLLTPNLA
jgi:DNA-binding HxlR family transcriptional regulator